MLHVLATMGRMRRLLSGGLVDATTRRVDVAGGSLAVLEHGAGGPAALCLHAPGELASEWRHLMAALDGIGFRTIAPELHGHGESDLVDPAPAVDDLAAVLDACGADAVLVVASGGAHGLATALAARHPDRVRRIVVSGTSAPLRPSVLLRRPWGPWVVVRRRLARERRPPADEGVYLRAVRASLARPGRLEAAVAFGAAVPEVPSEPAVPVLVLDDGVPHVDDPTATVAAIARFNRETLRLLTGK